jgi:uracil-DNA glycosylase family 4
MEDALEQLDTLAARVRACTRCQDLVECRTRAVPGGGHPHTHVMVVTWCPDEADEAGDGPAGATVLDRLADFMPALAGPAREQLYLTGLVKCVPRSGAAVREPRADEQEHCFEYLSSELSITTPHWILSVGEETSRFLLRKLFRDLPHGPGDSLELRVFDNPAFKVVPVATPDELATREPREQKAYRERLHTLSQRMGL